MDNYSTKISERMWNQPDKGELEAERENTFIDDIVQKSHIERELLQSLDGIRTAFDGGAGCVATCGAPLRFAPYPQLPHRKDTCHGFRGRLSDPESASCTARSLQATARCL